MSRTTLAVVTVVIGVALAVIAGAGAGTHDTVGGPRWTIVDLGTFGARWKSGSAAAVNARAQVVGTNGTAGGQQHAFLWQNGKMRDLGTLGGRDSGASAINASGQVIGTSLTSQPQHVHAFIWDDGKMTDLGTLGGKSSRPRALNDHGQVVGESFTAGGMVHAFLWQNGDRCGLGTLVSGELRLRHQRSGSSRRLQRDGERITARISVAAGEDDRSRDSRGALHEQHSDRNQQLGPNRRHELPREGHANRPAGPCVQLAERRDDRSRNARRCLRDQ